MTAAEIKPRKCRICQVEFTPLNQATILCSGCYYSGASHEQLHAAQLRQLRAAFPTMAAQGSRDGLWHTGGGCFCVGIHADPAQPEGAYVMLTDESGTDLPDPSNPADLWMLGFYEDDENHPEGRTHERLLTLDEAITEVQRWRAER